MDLKEIGVNVRNWFDSAQDSNYSRAHVNADIESPGFISHGVSSLVKNLFIFCHKFTNSLQMIF